MHKALNLVLLGAAMIAAASLNAENWPQFRGPTGQGVSTETGLPLKWSATENIAWKTALPGEAWSSPIVWGDRVFVTTATDNGASCRGLSLDRATGKLLWNQEVFTQVLTGRKEGRNTYATPTPATDGERVYACFFDGSLVALNYAGKMVWTNRSYKFYSQHGLGTSPILHRGLLMMARDGSSEGEDKGLGWQKPWDQAFILALDTLTGQERWKARRGLSRISHGVPAVWEHDGKVEIVSETGDVVQGFEARTGERLWSSEVIGEGKVPSTVIGEGLVFTAGGWGGKETIKAFRLGGQGDLKETQLVWQQKKGMPKVPSMLYLKPYLYVIADGGIATCLKAATGEIVWQERLAGKFSASPVGAEGHVYFLSDEGETTVIEAGPEFKVRAKNPLGENVQASMAVSQGQFFIRTEKNLICIGAKSRVVTYPAPDGEVLSDEYQVWADGQKVDVYTARTLDPPFAGKEWDFGGPYSFANFDTDGPVTVRVTAKRSVRDVVVRPVSAGAEVKVENENTVSLRLDGPRKLSLEPNGKRGPLLLFANPLEEKPPRPDAPDVIYFGPGLHRPGKIVVGSGQTLYLAGGAVVKGGVLAQGENLRITGRGILDGSDFEWRQGPTPTVISIRGTNVEVSGITIRGASHWTIVPRDSRQVVVRGVKLCGARVQNDDGINPCNSQDVLITDCFLRTDDDCVALKGLDFSAPNSNVERITVENCILWGDRARIFLLGHESRAPFMRGITLRNLDIIHFAMTPFLFEPGEEMRLEDVTVENIRIHGEGQNELIRLKPVVNQYMRNKVPGYIKNVRFRNLNLSGQAGRYRIQLEGADQQHEVQDIAFERVEILGEKLTTDSPRVHKSSHTREIRFTE